MAYSSRCLECPGVDPEWEKRELQNFSSGAIRSASSVRSFLLGRFLEEDLHVSCKPMLPPNIHQLNGSMIHGACILQVVDVVNIGANFDHRTDDTKGATRTLKFCLTDGYQTAYGFEYKWLPRLSVKTQKGTKLVIQNIVVRHGMLLLTPESCQVLGDTPADEVTPAPTAVISKPAGAYSAALMSGTGDIDDMNAENSRTSRLADPPAPPRPSSVVTGTTTPAQVQTAIARPEARGVVNPPVFVDISSDEDMGSDITDPMVEHLFYSPNTPRNQQAAQPQRSRKRPHPESTPQSTPQHTSKQHIVDMTFSPPPNAGRAIPAYTPSAPRPTPISRPSNRQDPFVYLKTSTQSVAAPQIPVGSTLTIRGFMKSVAGFQFNAGVYNLLVQIEDGTATKEVRVDPPLVQSLMGVSCHEFQQSMKTNPTVAHRLAAKMQVTLMTMQGIMTLRLDAQPEKWTLIDCREYSVRDAHALLARIQFPH